MDSPKEASALDQFERLRPEYARLTTKIEILVRDLLRAKGISVHLLESRTKEVDSLREKIVKSAKRYTDPLKEITDLSGLRIITYYQDEADAVANLIKSEFLIDQDNSVVHTATVAEFGYKSTHFVISLNQGRAALLEWQGLSDLKVEVQVRTVLQHAWAAISHKLQYKREEDVPAALKRKLFRLSALFELADDEFVSLRDASGAVTKQISELVAQGNRSLPLDYVSLSQLLESSPIVAELCAAAAEVGFDFDGDDGPQGEEEDRDTVSDLIQLANTAGILTIEGFEAHLQKSLPWARDYLEAQIEQSRFVGSSTWYVTPPFICELILVSTAVRKIKLGHLLRLGFARGVGTRVYEIAKQFGAEA